jgi:hypothetical protein
MEEKQKLTDVSLVCMVLLTFEYAFAEGKKEHYTIDEMYNQLVEFFNIEKDKVEQVMEEMCVCNICGKWQKKESDGGETIAYTLQSFKLKDGVVRVFSETPDM